MADLDTILKALDRNGDLPPLSPGGVFQVDLAKAIESLHTSQVVLAGLHLLNDDLGRAHPAAQSAEGDPTADYWHGIVHRREGDFGNSRYWLNRVGAHPVMTDVHGGLQGAVAFLDECRRVGSADNSALRQRQYDEMRRLLAHSLDLQSPET